MLLVILMKKKLLENFTKKKCKEKTDQKEFRVKKVLKRKGNKLYVKWKGYDESFNSWINKKHHSIYECIFSKTRIFWSKCKS